MAKFRYIKGEIHKNRTEQQTTMEYPELWDSQTIHVVAYEDNPSNLGEVVEYCLGVVTEEEAKKLIQDPGIVKVSIEEANRLGRKWKPQRTMVKDQSATIMAIANMANPAEETTEETMKILDPDNAIPGINKTKRFDITDFVAPGF